MLFAIMVLVGLLILVLFNLFFDGKKEGTKSVKDRMQNLRRPSKKEDLVRYESEKLDRPLVERLFLPMLKSIGKFFMKVTPVNLYATAVDKKTKAGSFFPWDVGIFIFLWLSTAICVTMIAAYYFLYLATDIDPFRAVMFTISAFIFGAYLPLMLMNILISKRKVMILKQLPEMLDLVCVSVQAGLAFDGALTKVTEHMKGPLVEECLKLLQEIKMGTPRRDALVNLADRCKLQEISLFTAAIIQSDRLGVALAKTLIIQSENMRERRRQTVKALALKAPVKIILPLIAFIFPSVFIIALGPSILTLMKSFK